MPEVDGVAVEEQAGVCAEASGKAFKPTGEVPPKPSRGRAVCHGDRLKRLHLNCLAHRFLQLGMLGKHLFEAHSVASIVSEQAQPVKACTLLPDCASHPLIEHEAARHQPRLGLGGSGDGALLDPIAARSARTATCQSNPDRHDANSRERRAHHHTSVLSALDEPTCARHHRWPSTTVRRTIPIKRRLCGGIVIVSSTIRPHRRCGIGMFPSHSPTRECGNREAAQAVALQVGTDVLPLLVNACSKTCIQRLPPPAPGYVQKPHQGGKAFVQQLPPRLPYRPGS